MKVLVTGGGGFLGTEICKQLKDAGHEVVSVSRNKYPHLETIGVTSFQSDLSSGRLELEGFEAVIHTAAKAGIWGKEEDYEKNNYQAAVNVFESAKASGVKYFIYTSSPSVVFGNENIENADETLLYPEKFYTHYARTKAKAEKLILGSSCDDIKSVSIRPHLIWGEGDPHLIPRIVSKGKNGQLKRVGDGTNLVDVIHVSNAARAHILALEALEQEKPIGGEAYFVGQERPVNLWEFIDKILIKAGEEPVSAQVSFKAAFYIGLILEFAYRLAGIRSPEPPMTRFLALQLGKSHYFSHEKAKKDLGYSPQVTIEEGLESLFAEKEAKMARVHAIEVDQDAKRIEELK